MGDRGHPWNPCHLHMVGPTDTSLGAAHVLRIPCLLWHRCCPKRPRHMLRVVLLGRGRQRVCSSEGFTLLDTIFVVALIGLLSAIAVPTLLRSRAAANETAALATLRMVHTGVLSYALSCGVGLWAANFQALADPGGGTGFLPSDLTAIASPTKSGYTYTLSTRASRRRGGGRLQRQCGRTRLLRHRGAPRFRQYRQPRVCQQ